MVAVFLMACQSINLLTLLRDCTNRLIADVLSQDRYRRTLGQGVTRYISIHAFRREGLLRITQRTDEFMFTATYQPLWKDTGFAPLCAEYQDGLAG